MRKPIKVKPVYFYEEDLKLLEKLETKDRNFQRIIKSLLNEWFYKNQERETL